VQYLVIILVFVIAIPTVSLVAAASITRKIRTHPPVVSSYEYHMNRFVHGADYDELEAALEDAESISKMEVQ